MARKKVYVSSGHPGSRRRAWGRVPVPFPGRRQELQHFFDRDPANFQQLLERRLRILPEIHINL